MLKRIIPKKRDIMAFRQGRIMDPICMPDGKIQWVQYARNVDSQYITKTLSRAPTDPVGTFNVQIEPSAAESGVAFLEEMYEPDEQADWEVYQRWMHHAERDHIGEKKEAVESIEAIDDYLPRSVKARRKSAPDMGRFIVPPKAAVDAGVEKVLGNAKRERRSSQA